MRAFDHPNMTNFLCFFCGTSSDHPVVLVPIEGTERDGMVEAKQVHAECYKVFCKMNNTPVSITNFDGEKI